MKQMNFIKIAAAFLLIGLGLSACARFATQKSDHVGHSPEVRGGELVVKFHAGTPPEEIAKIIGSFGKMEVIDAERKIFLVKSTAFKGSELDSAKALESQSQVEFAEPNFVVKTNDRLKIPQDPFWMSLWGMANYGQDAPNGVEGLEGADIGAQTAWAMTVGDRKVVVAVLDTGVDYAHSDLADNMWVNQKEKDGVPGVDDDANGYVDDIHGWDAVSDGRSQTHYGQVGDPDPMDDFGHGSHVAGTIGAVGGNGIGVVGVNWQVSIMAVKFLDENGSGASADEYRALRYILSNKVDVVNGSYGGGGRSKLIEMALKEGMEKGILFVFAAGNDSANNDSTPSFPANYPLDNVISVAATDARDQLAEFSNFGQQSVHIAAPGVSILSTVPHTMETALGAYDIYSGTSMATPHVAGAAALLLAAEPALRGNPAGIKQRLMETVDFRPNLASRVKSGGRLSISRAIAKSKAGNPDMDGQWQTLAYPIQTPMYSREKLDNFWTINVPGARALRVHFQFAQVESSFDVALLYDGQYRPIYNISGELSDEWSPITLGDTAYLKFSNALVSIDDGAPFANFNSAGVTIDRVEYLK